MLRYVDVIAGEARRMRLARISRGHDPRFLWQAGATARGVGSLFVRSYERGERVHLAMLSRGWTGRDAAGCPTPSPPGGSGLVGLAPVAVARGAGRDRMGDRVTAVGEPAATDAAGRTAAVAAGLAARPSPTRTATRPCTAST